MDKNLLKLNNLFLKGKEKTFKSHEVICDGENCLKQVFFIKEGYVKHYSLTKEGEEVVFHFFEKNSVFPLTLIISGKNPKHFFETISVTKLVSLPTEEFLTHLNQDSELLAYFLKNIARGLVGLTTRIESLISKQALYKTISLLLYFAQKNTTGDNYAEIKQNLTHKEFANWLGNTRETVSRQMEKLKKERLVNYQRGKLIIPDIKKLETRLTLLEKSEAA